MPENKYKCQLFYYRADFISKGERRDLGGENSGFLTCAGIKVLTCQVWPPSRQTAAVNTNLTETASFRGHAQ